MANNYTRLRYATLFQKYLKFKVRLDRHFKNDTFRKMTARKRNMLLRRLERLKTQLQKLSLSLKFAGAGAAMALTLALSAESYAQTVLPVGSEFAVNIWTTNDQTELSIAMDSDGDFVMVWSSDGQDGDNDGVYAQRYNASGIAQGSEFLVNTYTTNIQRSPSIAMDSDGDFVIVWSSRGQDGSDPGVYAQRYDASGTPQGGEFLVNTYTTGFQVNPSVAMDSDGDFVIAWSSDALDGNGRGIFARRYDASGIAQGSEFQVNTWTTGTQNSPSIAMDSDGDFVIAWTNYDNQDGDNYGIYAQRFNSSGVSQGSEFQVNTYTTGRQIHVSVAMDSDGDFVIVWYSAKHDGNDNEGVYAQRYDASGVAQGGELLVNSYTTDSQKAPSIAMDSDGDFVITWQSYRDGDYYGVYAQRFDASGTAQGTEFQVNTWTTKYQYIPSIAMDSDGDFVIGWESYDQDGSYYGIYAQRYLLNNAPAISDQVFSIDENSSSGTVVGTVTASDADAGQTLSYAITAGNTGNAFAINSSTGEITVTGALDFETTPFYTLTVEVSDDGTVVLSASATITINVNDVTETGVVSAYENNSIRVYPNPSSGELLITSDVLPLEGYRLSISNILGEIVFENAYVESISLHHLPKGVYLLRLEGNGKAMVKQVVVR